MHSVQISKEESKQESETSTNRDISMVLNHSIQSEEDFLVDLKQKKPSAANKPFISSCSGDDYRKPAAAAALSGSVGARGNEYEEAIKTL